MRCWLYWHGMSLSWSGWWTDSYLLVGRVVLILVHLRGNLEATLSDGHHTFLSSLFSCSFLLFLLFLWILAISLHKKNINNNISFFQNLRLCIQTWTNIFNKSFKWIPYFIHSQSSVFLTFTFLTVFPYQLNSHLLCGDKFSRSSLHET